MVGFYIKKFISFLLEPYTMALFLLLLSVILLFIKRGFHFVRIFVLVSFFICYFLSSGWVANALLQPLESQYPPVSLLPNDVNTVVVLSGGIQRTPLGFNAFQLSYISFQRTFYGISLYQRIHSHYPKAQLILSGGNPYYSQVTESEFMRQVAKQLGVADSAVRKESQSYDTSQQAKNIRNIVKDAPFFLVTSALHMPRSMALFHKQGMTPIAAPCDFHTLTLSFWQRLKPDLQHFKDSQAALHEYLGMLWGKLHQLI